jgi:NHL repeat
MGVERTTVFQRCTRVLAGMLPVLVVLLLGARSASAATEAFGPRFCLTGAAAGRCDYIRGVAASPVDGHLFIADRRNDRINEFTAWGEFVESWGWGVDDGSSELQTCTAATGCQAGLEGTGVGEFIAPHGIAVDSSGDVYVTDPAAHRVQKFTPNGQFLLMFGGGVDQGPNHPGNVCTAQYVAEGDICGAGTAGTGNGEFSGNWPFSSNMAIGPGDQVYVGDRGRIQEFDSGGTFIRVLPDPDQVLRNGNAAEDRSVGSLAVDPSSGNLYLAYPNTSFEADRPGVFRLDQGTGELIATIQVNAPTALATDESGNVYVFDEKFTTANPSLSHGSRLLKFDSSGSLIETIAETANGSVNEIDESVGIATGSFCFGPGENGLYIGARREFKVPTDFVQAYGPTPDPEKCAPPQVPPSLDAQFAAQVGTESAALKAKINPHYFTQGVGTTTYYVQWASAACIESEGWTGACVQEQPVPPGTAIDSPPVNEDLTTEALVLEDLAPNTAYRYRFVTEGSGKPGEPIVGVGGEPGVEGADAGFTTLPLPSGPTQACPNEAFRTGPGAGLRDCRAYELVSPLGKAGGDAQPRLNIPAFDARMDEAALDGNSITFSAYRPFEDPSSAPYSSQYLTRRDPEEGWGTEAISPPQEGEAFINPLIPIDNAYRAFSPDLSQAWLVTDTEPVLGPGGLAGHPNLYRRDNGSGAYAACTTAVPQLSEEGTQAPQLQGFSADGNLAIFRVQNKLTDNASEKLTPGGHPIYQLYACSYGGGVASVHLVSVLPNGTASELENTGGGPANELFQFNQGRTESLENAVSAAGSKVFWTASPVYGFDGSTPGALYLRLNPAAAETPSGECEESEPGAACTVLIDAGPARFWTAAKDGSVAIFSDSSGALKEYEVATAETHSIAPQVVGVLGASEDASRVYFLSEEEIGGNGEAGEPNLYLYDKTAESTTFIATLSEEDASQSNRQFSPANPRPAWHTARVTPNGTAVAFMSNDPQLAEEVAGYDNTDQVGGLPAAEIYRYAAGEGLSCISCNRSGQRPRGREVQNKFNSNAPVLYAAAMLPPWLNSLYAPRVLSSNGKRIFFEAFEPLVLEDTNEKADVYQWEALGTGSCEEADSAFDPQSGGCLSLLSSGTSTTDSQFVDASPDGRDVFIRTASSLVGWDPGSIDIYDARVLGGFPAPPSPEPECEEPGGAGQCPAEAKPEPPRSSSGTAQPGPGNTPHITKPKKHCPKGTHRVKKKGGGTRCVKNRHHHKPHKRGRAGR